MRRYHGQTDLIPKLEEVGALQRLKTKVVEVVVPLVPHGRVQLGAVLLWVCLGLMCDCGGCTYVCR